MKTILYDTHVKLQAKMVDFAGWQMPIYYQGILQEHRAVRSCCGIFDVSHMGRIEIEGEDAEALLDYLSTNQIAGKKEASVTYTVWCHEAGGCVDDLLVYRINQHRFFIIVNAGNREKDLRHLLSYAKGKKVKVTPHYEDEGILAIQGPLAVQRVLAHFSKANHVLPMHFAKDSFQGQEIILSRTGYTGAGGFEIIAPKASLKSLWDLFIQDGVTPIGLGARDTLRLEMGYALYGHELSDSISASESVSAWTIRGQGRDFLGIAHLSSQRASYGVVLEGERVARQGYPVYSEGSPIGEVTSGGFSPSLNCAIALVLVEKSLESGDTVELMIRNNLCPATVVRLPFFKEVKI